MDPFLAKVGELLRGRSTAALGTLHEGGPRVSLVPFALHAGAALIHVSGLAAHTRDLETDPRASLLVAEPEDRAADLRSLARVTLQAEARTLAEEDPSYPAARRTYLARFPDSEGFFDLGDFRLVVLELREGRAVLGFAQARSLSAEDLRTALDA